MSLAEAFGRVENDRLISIVTNGVEEGLWPFRFNRVDYSMEYDIDFNRNKVIIEFPQYRGLYGMIYFDLDDALAVGPEGLAQWLALTAFHIFRYDFEVGEVPDNVVLGEN